MGKRSKNKTKWLKTYEEEFGNPYQGVIVGLTTFLVITSVVYACLVLGGFAVDHHDKIQNLY